MIYSNLQRFPMVALDRGAFLSIASTGMSTLELHHTFKDHLANHGTQNPSNTLINSNVQHSKLSSIFCNRFQSNLILI
jgi:hypothetical protein